MNQWNVFRNVWDKDTKGTACECVYCGFRPGTVDEIKTHDCKERHAAENRETTTDEWWRGDQDSDPDLQV